MRRGCRLLTTCRGWKAEGCRFTLFGVEKTGRFRIMLCNWLLGSDRTLNTPRYHNVFIVQMSFG
jgi:hypothetical protein